MGDYVGVFSIKIRNKIWKRKTTLWNIKVAWRNLRFRETKESLDRESERREWTEHIFEHVTNTTRTFITNIDVVDTVEKD